MTAFSPKDGDSARSLRLSEEVTRIATAIADLSVGLSGAPRAEEGPKEEMGSDRMAKHVERIIHARRTGTRFLEKELFGEPAWDMLLNLLCCGLRGRRLSTSDLCLAAGVPATTALRWIRTMAERGLVIREADAHDSRRIFVRLAPTASASLRRYFAQVIERQ